jgi:hypothetical protein
LILLSSSRKKKWRIDSGEMVKIGGYKKLIRPGSLPETRLSFLLRIQISSTTHYLPGATLAGVAPSCVL